MDGGAWSAAVHGVTKNRTRLSTSAEIPMLHFFRNQKQKKTVYLFCGVGTLIFFWQEGPFNLSVMRIGALKKASAYRGSGSLSISGFLGV